MSKKEQPTEIKDFWKKVMAEIQLKVDSITYRTIFNQLSAENINDSSVDILCATPVLKANLEKKFMGIISESVQKVAKKPIEINIIIKQKREQLTANLGPLFEQEHDPEELINEKVRRAGLAPKFTFENFILGKNNQLAFAIATAVAENPGESYNPVFIYSGVGLGKTHLIQAVGNHILRKSPSLKVIYTTGESFTNELIESIQGGKARKYTSNEFRNKFRKADVFLIDDVQFIAGKEATQDEFFHTFNALYMAQKQIIITSDRPPRDFKNITERITSRFNSGIIADIQAPDFETRAAILRARRDKSQDQISNEVISIIAEKVSTNIRELEGAYLQVLTKTLASGTEPTPDSALEILGQTIKLEKKKPVNINSILKAVCNYYSVRSSDIKGKRRTKEIVIPRQVAMYLIYEMTDTPYMAIGDLLGGRDHTTIMHGVEKIQSKISQTGKIRQDIINVRQLLTIE